MSITIDLRERMYRHILIYHKYYKRTWLDTLPIEQLLCHCHPMDRAGFEYEVSKLF